MRLLVFYPYIPYPPDRGTYHRAYHLLRALAKDHEVDLLCLAENGERMEHKPLFEQFCRKVVCVPFQHPPWARLFPDRILHPLPTTIRHWSLPHIAEAVQKQMAENSYDLVHAYDIVLAQYFLDDFTHVPLAVDRTRVDLQFQMQGGQYISSGWRSRILDWENRVKLARFEKRIARRVAAEIVCGPDDETFIREHISSTVPVLVVVNGVDLDYFNSTAAGTVPRDTHPTLIFCGAMDYPPNVDALRWFFAEIHALLLQQVPDLQLLIVGRSPTAEVTAYGKIKGVTVTGGVPDVRPYYQRAWMQMVPLRIGGGTRLKIPESMAVGTPVISTTIGAQGLDLIHNHDILLADTAETFAAETARALKDARLRINLENNGRKSVQERLAWPTVGIKLSRFYTEWFSCRHPRCHAKDDGAPTQSCSSPPGHCASNE